MITITAQVLISFSMSCQYLKFGLKIGHANEFGIKQNLSPGLYLEEFDSIFNY